MNHGLQLSIRIASPIILTMISIILFTSKNWNEVFGRISNVKVEIFSYSIVSVLAVIFGYFFHKFIRSFFINQMWAEIDRKVKENLIKGLSLNSHEEQKVLNSKKGLIRIFFNIIDASPSLTKTSEKILLNGAILSGLYDVLLFSVSWFFVPLFQLDGENFLNFKFHIVALGFLVMNIAVHFILYFKSLHIEMGSEQIDEIRRYHFPVLTDFVSKLLKDL